MEFLSISFTITVKTDCHKLQKFQKFQETSTLHLTFQSMLSYFPKAYLFPVSAFADYFSSLVRHIVPSINSDLQLFI